MQRKLFSFVTALSLLLCVSAGALWSCRYRTGWRWQFGSPTPPTLPGTQWEVLVGRTLVIDREEWLFSPRQDGTHVHLSRGYSSAQEFPGVHVTRAHSFTRPRLPGEESPFRDNMPARLYHKSFRLSVSFLLVAAAGSVLPLLWLWRQRSWRREARVRVGLCPACGYDLRATPQRCPECGCTNAAAPAA